MSEKRVMGCLLGKKDIRDYKIKRKVAMSVNYPEAFECEKQRGKIKNQGSVGSCVAHATSEILEYHTNGTQKLATDFIYGIRNKLFGSTGTGMTLRDACKIVKSYGDPQLSYCPTNTEVTAVFKIAESVFTNEEAMEDAKNHRISSYAQLRNDEDIKYALMNYGPVLACVQWFSDYKISVRDGILHKGVKPSGYHAIMIYGWNEEGWLCQNSWGTGFGQKGLFILPHDYQVAQAYSLVPTESNEDLNIPVRNCVFDLFYKLINWIINLFN